MAVKLEFTAEDAGLTAMNAKLADSVRKVERAYEGSAKQVREVERAAVRGFNRAMTPLGRYNKRLEDLKRLLNEGKITQQAFEGAALDAAQALDRQGDAGKSALGAIGLKLAGIATSYVSIQSAIQLVVGEYRTWLEETNQLTEATNKMARDVRVFAALQGGGLAAERAERVIGAARRAGGVADPGMAWDITQALQSTLGDFDKGLKGAIEVFEAARSELPLELGRELAMRGSIQTGDPTLFLRLASAAGKASGRTPADIGGAVGAVRNFQDATVGFATLAALVGDFGNQTEVYARQLGIGLSNISSAMDSFRNAGLEEATQLERLAWLSKQLLPYREDENKLLQKIEELGFTEIRQQQALLVAAKATFKEGAEGFNGILKTIRSGASDMEVFRRQIEETGKAFPQTKIADELESLKLEQAAIEGSAINSQLETLRQTYLASEFKERGIRSAFGRPLVEEGRVSPFKEFMAKLSTEFTSTAYETRVFEAVDESNRRFEEFKQRELSEARNQTELLEAIKTALEEGENSRYRDRRARPAAASPP